MAIARGAGTEIIRTVMLDDIDGSLNTELIYGVQHHIYTVLSIVVLCTAINSSASKFAVHLKGYDSKGGLTNVTHNLLQQSIALNETFVWNDKFSFNGFEPIDFGTGGVDSAVKQDAIADQGSSVAQYLFCNSTAATDSYEMVITFIDQNNA